MTAYRRSYKRLAEPGEFYFFTMVTFKRRPMLTSEPARQSLRLALRETRAKYPFQMAAVCLLPDHLHCIWRLPAGDADFSNRIKSIKKRFTTAYEGEAGKVRQNRFWEHSIRDEDSWRRRMDYIHFNPVKHGYADSPGNWPFSSFRRCVKKGFYAPDWGSDIPEDVLHMNLE